MRFTLCLFIMVKVNKNLETKKFKTSYPVKELKYLPLLSVVLFAGCYVTTALQGHSRDITDGKWNYGEQWEIPNI